MTAREMEKVVRELASIFDELDLLVGLDISDDRSTLYPPAAEEAIAEFEERHQPFPESYRTFLRLHNGWEKYQHTFTLIGVSGAHTKRALQDIKEDMRVFMMKWGKRSTDPEFIARYESKGRKNAKTLESARIYLPNRLVFGTDFAGDLLFFNPASSGRRGAAEVIYRDQHFRILERHADFTDMLQDHLRFYREELSDQRKKTKKESR
jgi:cell wall assembly regulator SMI1